MLILCQQEVHKLEAEIYLNFLSLQNQNVKFCINQDCIYTKGECILALQDCLTLNLQTLPLQLGLEKRLV